jgi:hypothetical protein
VEIQPKCFDRETLGSSSWVRVKCVAGSISERWRQQAKICAFVANCD